LQRQSHRALAVTLTAGPTVHDSSSQACSQVLGLGGKLLFLLYA